MYTGGCGKGGGGAHPALCPRGLLLFATPEGRGARAGPSALPRGDTLWNLASPPPRPLKRRPRNAGPRHHTLAAWGWGRSWQSSASGSAPPRVKNRGESFHLVSTQLGSRGTRGNCPKPRRLCEARLRGCRDSLRAGPGREDSNLHPPPVPGPTPRRLPAPPLQAAHLARPLPAPGPPPMGCSHCAASPSAASSQPKMAAAATDPSRRLPLGRGSLRTHSPAPLSRIYFLPRKD